MPKQWNETYDVVVIGSGFAGLAAAIEARNNGANVIVLEKMPVYGGNSIINGGVFGAWGTKLQQEAGVKPSNPHTSPHYGMSLDCNLCHHQHAKSENYCSQCHKFDFKVP